MVRIIKASLAVLLALAALAAPNALAATGDLDTTWAGYGTGGQMLLDFPGSLEAAYPYGDKVVALGGNGSEFVVALYAADGQLDTTFGGDGIVTVDVGAGADSATTVRIYSGQFYVAGSASGDFGVVKLNADGSLDTTFGGDGKVTVDFNGQVDRPVAALFRGDGKLLLAGSAIEAGAQFCGIIACHRNLALARLDFSTGALDTTFDGDGKAQTDLGADEYMLAAAYGGASIVAAGATCGQFTCQFLIAKYTLTGALDTAFDSDGILTGALPQVVSALAIAPAGTIMAAGPTASGFALLAFTASGAPDTSFGGGDGLVENNWGATDLPRAIVYLHGGQWLVGGATDGDRFALTRFDDVGDPIWYFDTGTPHAEATFSGGSSAALTSAAQMPDGRLWALGRVSVDGQVRLALSRHFAEGLPDAGGWQVTHANPFESLDEEAGRAAVFQPDGKLIVAGTFTPYESDGGIGLVRYTADGQLDTAFDGDGVVYLDLLVPVFVEAVALQPDGKILVAGYTEYTLNDEIVQDFLTARFNADGALDTTFGDGGIAIGDFGPHDKAYAMALQPDGKIILAGEAVFPLFLPLAPSLVVTRLLADGSLDTAFGNGGYTGSAGSDIRGYAVALQPDGKIVAAGTVSGNFLLTRFTASGQSDGDFNTSGAVIADFGGYDVARAVLVQPGGEILAFGDDGQSALFARYTALGAPDTSFDSDGRLVLPDGASAAHALAFRNGTIFAVGCDFGVVQQLASLYRLNADGSPVQPGQPYQDFSLGTNFCAYALALRPGRVALAGTVANQAADIGVAMVQTDYRLYLPIVLRP